MPPVRRQLAAVRAFVAMKLPVAHLADEITHESFVVAFRNLDALNSTDSSRAWLREIAGKIVPMSARPWMRWPLAAGAALALAALLAAMWPPRETKQNNAALPGDDVASGQPAPMQRVNDSGTTTAETGGMALLPAKHTKDTKGTGLTHQNHCGGEWQLPGGARDSRAVCGDSPQTPDARVFRSGA